MYSLFLSFVLYYFLYFHKQMWQILCLSMILENIKLMIHKVIPFVWIRYLIVYSNLNNDCVLKSSKNLSMNLTPIFYHFPSKSYFFEVLYLIYSYDMLSVFSVSNIHTVLITGYSESRNLSFLKNMFRLHIL